MSNKELSDIETEIAVLRKFKHDNADSLTVKEEREFTEKIKLLSEKLVAAITEGASACKVCEKQPHGMIQKTIVKKKSMPYFEIGCLNCADRRSQGFSREDAVSDWNDESFVPPSEKA